MFYIRCLRIIESVNVSFRTTQKTDKIIVSYADESMLRQYSNIYTMGGTCTTHEGGEKCVTKFSLKALKRPHRIFERRQGKY
jgi:hypothetical protein